MATLIEDQPAVAAASKGSPILRSVASNWGRYAFSVCLAFFLAPYVVWHLGNSAYGVWSLVVSITGYLGLFDLGVRGAVTRYVARFHAQADHGKSSEVASAAMAIFLATGAVAVMVSGLLAVLVLGRLNLPPQFLYSARVVVLLIGCSVAVSLLDGVYGGLLIALQRFDLSNAVEIANSGLRAAAIVAALSHGFGLIALASLHLGFAVMRLLADFLLAHRLYPELRARPWSVDRTNLGLIWSFSLFSFLLHVSLSLIYASDLVVVGAFLPVTAVTFYAVGGNLVDYARALVTGISQTMTPLTSALEARQYGERLREIVLRSSSWATMVALPVTVTFLIRGGTFIGLWMGPQYAGLSGTVLRVLTLSLPFWAGFAVVSSAMLGISRHKPLVPVALLEGLCNLGLSIFLVKRMGVAGVAWGTLIPSLLASLFFCPWYLRHVLGVPVRRYLLTAWLKPGLAILPFATVSYTVEHYWPVHNLFLFFIQIALCFPLALIAFWGICLNPLQRTEYSQKFWTLRGHAVTRAMEGAD
jgi:O-antigen/teichoic acid export membrane protein